MREEMRNTPREILYKGFDVEYLEDEGDLFDLTKSYGIYVGQKMVGFAITPTYGKPGVLIRIFIRHQNRRQGIGRQVISQLMINMLSIIKRDVDAIRFYERLGFEVFKDGHTHPALVDYALPRR